MPKQTVKGPRGVKIVKHTVGADTMWTQPASADCKCNRLLVAYAKNGKVVWVKNGFSV